MSPDPLSVFFSKKAIDIAVGKIDQLLLEASKKDEWRVELCEKFLEACNEAIQGLEKEYDEILVQTGNIDGTPEGLKDLKIRIEEYLKIDKLRNKLIEAIAGLDFYQVAFEQKATSIFNWPWKKKDKKKAAQQFSETLKELNTYLKNLSEQELPFRAAGTGVGIEALFAILGELENDGDDQIKSLKDLSKKYQLERDKEPMIKHITKIRELIERLHKEFR